jgi:phosphoribosylformimino-5-aminoimidazole carboxamide ribotide isomerase
LAIYIVQFAICIEATPVLIIPAIDIKDGRCVRLFQGEIDKETIYFDSPLNAAKHWVAEGATFIHIVDLNGAVEGRPVHTKDVKAICKETALSVELGGGLRSLDAIEEALALGVDRVVTGTKAAEDTNFLRSACEKFPGKIVVGIDARNGKVAVKGWKETTTVDALDLAKRCASDGASRIIYTDISRDGTREGINIAETRRLAQSVKIPVIASGGVATLDDIRQLLPLEKQGVEGVIVGRALYIRAFTLREAQAIRQ